MRSTLLIALAVFAACQDSDVSRAVGARCERNTDCDDRCLVSVDDWPGGFCTLDCDDDGDCPDDASCIREDSGGVCAFSCFRDENCAFLGGGYECKERDAIRDIDPPRLVCRG